MRRVLCERPLPRLVLGDLLGRATETTNAPAERTRVAVEDALKKDPPMLARHVHGGERLPVLRI